MFGFSREEVLIEIFFTLNLNIFNKQSWVVHVDLSVLFVMKTHVLSVYMCFKGIILGNFPWYKSTSTNSVTRDVAHNE